MPNIIRNHLQIIGNEIEVNKIKELVKTESKLFDFNKVIPMPELEKEEVEIYMSDELILSWCINNWGTKWNCWDETLSGNEFEFNTANTIPEPILIKLSREFKNIQFVLFSINSTDLTKNELTFVNGQCYVNGNINN